MSLVQIVLADCDATNWSIIDPRDQRERDSVRTTSRTQPFAPRTTSGVGIISAPFVPVPCENRVCQPSIVCGQECGGDIHDVILLHAAGGRAGVS
jgi:hypothetical protein